MAWRTAGIPPDPAAVGPNAQSIPRVLQAFIPYGLNYRQVTPVRGAYFVTAPRRSSLRNRQRVISGFGFDFQAGAGDADLDIAVHAAGGGLGGIAEGVLVASVSGSLGV